MSSTASIATCRMPFRPQEAAKSLSHTVTRLRIRARPRAGRSRIMGLMPRALAATTSLAPDIRPYTLVHASNSVTGTVICSDSGRAKGINRSTCASGKLWFIASRITTTMTKIIVRPVSEIRKTFNNSAKT